MESICTEGFDGRHEFGEVYQLPDAIWERMEALLPKYRPSPKDGRPRLPVRNVTNGIFYVLLTGGQWKALPSEFGSDSAIHVDFQEWPNLGVFAKLWKLALEEYDQLAGIDWQWQSLDGAMTEAPLSGEKNRQTPTDRGKLGVKRSVLTEGRGVPIGAAVSGVNAHDQTLVTKTFRSIPIHLPKPARRKKQHLWADKGYDAESIRTIARRRHYIAHIPKK
jgi:putative transposase